MYFDLLFSIIFITNTRNAKHSTSISFIKAPIHKIEAAYHSF